MALYIIRVELHEAPVEAYNVLQRNLMDAGLSKTLIDTQGGEYELPPAEFAYAGEEGTAELRDLIKPYLAAIDPLHAVVVMRVDDCAWYGLRKVTKPDAASLFGDLVPASSDVGS